MLYYAPQVAVDGKPPQSFWLYRYDIKDPGAILRSLVERGFIVPGAAVDAVAAQKVSDLKKVLADHGQKVSGSKAELVARALMTIDTAELDALFPDRSYALTSTGQAAVDGAPHILFAHQHQEIDGLDIFRIAELRTERPGVPWRDLVWSHLDQQGLKLAQQGSWGLYANVRRAMADFLAEEGQYLDAIARMVEAVHWSLSGVSNGFNSRNLRMHAETTAPFIAFDHGRSIVSIPPGNVANIFKWATLAEQSRDDLWHFLSEQFRRHDAPMRIFTPDELTGIVFMAKDENAEDLEQLYAQAAARFRRTYRI